MEFSGCPDDASLGPAVQGCRGNFDFTLKFEKIFFALIPASIFIAVSVSRIVYLTRRPLLVGGALLRSVKVAAALVYSVVQLCLLVLSTTRSLKYGMFFIPAAAVTFVSSLSMIWLSLLEHSRSPRPSMLLNAYLFLTILLDVAQTRTLWLASGNFDEITFTRLFTTGVATKAVLVLLESRHKTRWVVNWDVKQHSPEETTGLYGLGAFFWLNKLFVTGYRKLLTMDDLFPLDRAIASEALLAKLAGRLDVSRIRGQDYGLAKALARGLAVPLLLPVGPRIALTAFQFCQPFLIETLLNYLGHPEEESSQNTGYGLIGATIIVYTGIAISGAFYWYFQERAMYMVRGVLASVIYDKTTEASASASDNSASITLMSGDVERIIRGFLGLHDFWSSTIEVALACWLLYRQIGASFVAPLIVVACCILCIAFLARFMGPRQKQWMELIQKRVGLTSNTIRQMKHIKISGLAGPVEESIQKMREDELKAGSRFRGLSVVFVLISFAPALLSPTLTFAFAAKSLDTTLIFTSISYIILLANPLTTLFQTVPGVVASFACLSRIQAYLETKSRFDFREEEGPSSSPRTGSSGSAEKASEGKDKAGHPAPGMKITSRNFGWKSGDYSLKNLNLEIKPSRLTIVVGPVASGKSTLCKVLLGEVPIAEGRVIMDRASSWKIGYCDQNPYLTNATVRENIVGFSPFNEERYNEVIDATALQPDLALFPRGDNTKIGSNGITLSGGQKQRVSMARALYLDSDFLVFDDILSGLDADTEEQVFRRVFSPGGLLRRRNATTVLCTHSVRHLPSADHIISLGPDGSLVEQGSFGELMANKMYVSSLGVKETGGTKPDGDAIHADDTDKSTQSDVLNTNVTVPSSDEAENEAERMVGGDTTVYRHYFARIGVVTSTSLFGFAFACAFFANFSTIWVKFWTEDLGRSPPEHSNAYYNGLYGLFQVTALICLYFTAYVGFTVMIFESGRALHHEALRTVIGAPLSFFTKTDTGVVTNLFSQDMTLIDGQLPMSLVNVALYMFNCVSMAAVIATSSPYLAITYPFLSAILYGMQRFYLRTSRQIRLLDLEAKSPLYTHFIDTIKGITTFRAFGWVPQGVARNHVLLDDSQRPAYLLAMI